MSTNNDVVFDVSDIPCSVKHGQILARWRELGVGEYFILKNGHDPVPLKYQFEAQFPGCFTWEHLERGPESYQIKIQKLKAIPAGEVKVVECCGH